MQMEWDTRRETIENVVQCNTLSTIVVVKTQYSLHNAYSHSENYSPQVRQLFRFHRAELWSHTFDEMTLTLL